MKRLLFVSALLSVFSVGAQDKPALQLSAYGELYYGYDFNEPQDHNRPDHIVSYGRHNEVNLNLAYLKAAYESKHIRGNVALMTGTYSNANLAAEPGVLKNILEANAGVKLSRKQELWVDAGIMPSHIGLESAVGKDNRTLTRSLMADNSPYFETGVRFSYKSINEKWYAALLYLNGWQNIQRKPANNTPAFGLQLTYTPSDKLTINYSNIVCNNEPDSLRKWRWYHNFYAVYKPAKRWEVAAVYDIGAEQVTKGDNAYGLWYSPALILRYAASKKIAIAARCEYYDDYYGLVVRGATSRKFRTWGNSLGLDYSISKHALFRIEGKYYSSGQFVFAKYGMPVKNNLITTAALCVWF